MKKKSTKLLFLVTGFIAALLLAFLAGGFSYRAGFLTSIKQLFIPVPQPTSLPIEIQPLFEFKFLDDPFPASMNSLSIENNDLPLTFLVAGHIYGKPGDDEFHPALTLLSNIASLKEMDPDFVAFLGDTVWRPSEENFNYLEMLIIDQMNIPVFNAVGNHDVTNRDLYQDRYGSTVYAFKFKKQLFIILDTTLKNYDLSPNQYSFILDTIKEQSSDLEAVHLFMHHVLFLNENEIFGKQLIKPNEGDGTSPNFLAYLETYLIPISKITPIYIYAGDVGAFQGGNLSPFYKRVPGEDIYLFATGLGNNPNDSILIVEVSENGEVHIRPHSLNGNQMNAIESYTMDYWSIR